MSTQHSWCGLNRTLYNYSKEGCDSITESGCRLDLQIYHQENLSSTELVGLFSFKHKEADKRFHRCTTLCYLCTELLRGIYF